MRNGQPELIGNQRPSAGPARHTGGVPIAEEPEPRPAGQPDPFEGLVLDEEFVRAAAVKEQSGRTRMLAARWKHQPPVDPGGRRSVNDGPKRKRSGKGWQTLLIVIAMVAIVLFGLKVAQDTVSDQPPVERPAPTAPAVPADQVPRPV